MSRDRHFLSGGTALAACAIILMAKVTECRAETLKREPGAGALRCNQVVLVDDRSCPKGQIKQVTGGCNMGGANTAGPPRVRRCVPR
jgi:uncharacterized protein DUF6719